MVYGMWTSSNRSVIFADQSTVYETKKELHPLLHVDDYLCCIIHIYSSNTSGKGEFKGELGLI